MSKIIPTLLATSEKKYKEDLDKVLSSEELANGWVQIDIMDNKFVPNLSVGLDVIGKYPFDSKKEAHLMVQEPQDWIEGLANLQFARIIFPLEVGNTLDLIDKVKEYSLQVGVALNPETPVDKVLPFIDKIDVVLIMAVHPGFQGEEFIVEALGKVKELFQKRIEKGLSYEIEVDGGIHPGIAKELEEAGVDGLAVGSKLFNGNIQENLEKFKQALQES
ncbi:MAG: ribulose-phosphate 3-epimerase [Candidatus Daviesbacteria bacterium]|nr:ribulose-phosphate 3-epimerase [Candidatus Daviesbacteria bacterium]